MYAGESGMGGDGEVMQPGHGIADAASSMRGIDAGCQSRGGPGSGSGSHWRGAAKSWMLENLGPKITERDFNPGFMVKLMQKDLRLALALARALEKLAGAEIGE